MRTMRMGPRDGNHRLREHPFCGFEVCAVYYPRRGCNGDGVRRITVTVTVGGVVIILYPFLLADTAVLFTQW